MAARARQVPSTACCQNGARTHADVLEDVCKCAPALPHACCQNGQIGRKQDHVSCCACDFGCPRDGYSDMCCMDRRRIVDAVAHESHDMTAVAQGLNDPSLLIRINPCKKRYFAHPRD